MRRRGQSTVELMIIVPLLMVVVVAMYQLWSVAWASQNAHLRAREYVLHGDTYLQDRGADVTGNSVFSGGKYRKADSTDFSFSASAEDESLAGVSRGGEQIRVTATITSD